MSREIKFRLWDEVQKIMYQPEQADFLIQTDGKVNSHELGILEGYFHTPQLLPLQYTGLKDKNGVQIYEGDVLMVPDLYETPENTSASFHNEEINYTLGCFYSGGKPMFDCWDYLSDEAEVIGNIYENPELMERQS